MIINKQFKSTKPNKQSYGVFDAIYSNRTFTTSGSLCGFHDNSIYVIISWVKKFG